MRWGSYTLPVVLLSALHIKLVRDSMSFYQFVDGSVVPTGIVE